MAGWVGRIRDAVALRRGGCTRAGCRVVIGLRFTTISLCVPNFSLALRGTLARAAVFPHHSWRI